MVVTLWRESKLCKLGSQAGQSAAEGGVAVVNDAKTQPCN